MCCLFTFVAALALSIPSLAQERVLKDASAKPASPAKPLTSYIVELTEYQLSKSEDRKLDFKNLPQAIEAMKKDGSLKVAETTRVSALEGYPTTLQLGKSVAMTTGTNLASRGISTRSITYVDVGTTAELTPTTKDGQVLLSLSYQSGRVGESKDADIPQGVQRNSYKTTILVKPGTPTLVGSSTSDPSSLLIISVTER